MRNKKSVIFDVDGLLIDSEPLWYQAREHFAAKYQVTVRPEIHTMVIGRSSRGLISIMQKELGIPGDTDQLTEEFRKIYHQLASIPGRLLLMPGAIELIESLYPLQPLGIATGGYTKEVIEELLERLAIRKFFTVVASSDQVENGKPHPDVFLLTAQQMKADPINCFVLEDAINGVLAGKAAKMTVFGIHDAEDMRTKLSKAGADKVFKSLEQVKPEYFQ